MTKIQNFAKVLAIAITCTFGLSSCTSSGEEVYNPNYNPETNEVSTKFVFNVSTGNTTRQSSAATQATEDEFFRGIDDAVLFSYKQGSDGQHLSSPTTMDKCFDLSQIVTPSMIDKDNSRRVIETTLPINTNTLVFYGRATPGSASSTETSQGYKAYDLFGHLDDYNPGNGTDLTKANFELGTRLKDGNVNDFKKVQQLLGGILTCILNTNMSGDNRKDISASATPSDGVAPYTYDVAKSEIPEGLSWSSYLNANNESPMESGCPLYPLEVKLANVFEEMTTIRDAEGELRAGYGKAVLFMVQDMWSVINEVRCATPFVKHEAVAKYMANLISEHFEDYFNATLPNEGGNVTDVAFKGTSKIVENFEADDTWPTAAGTKPSGFSSLENITNVLSDFPRNFSLPSGAAHLKYDKGTKVMSYAWNFNTSAVGGEGGFTPESYYYPSELLYFGNSPLRTSDNELPVNSYPNGVANWDNDENWTGWFKDSHVVSTTKSVAMKNDINYGTALLRTTVRYGADVLKDNNHAIQKHKYPTIGDNDEPDKQITVTGSSFELVSVTVGGQKKKVGWDFLPQTTGNETGYVTDIAIPATSGKIPAYSAEGAKSVPNYTLLFDNYTPADHQETVYVALEFKNNSGQNFFGEYGLIRKDSYFYLIGELNPEDNGLAAITWPTHHPLPPYKADGTSVKTPRVFMQDYMTIADFVIGPSSLKHAYLTVPDLRYSSLTLGLSVDIKWSTGLNFGEIILGGDQ